MGHDFPGRISSSDLTKLVLSIHTKVSAMDMTSLESTIIKHDSYRLRDVCMDEIQYQPNNDSRVAHFARLCSSTMPPIVLGQKFTNGRYDLIDGWHRINAAVERGAWCIRAYVLEECMTTTQRVLLERQGRSIDP